MTNFHQICPPIPGTKRSRRSLPQEWFLCPLLAIAMQTSGAWGAGPVLSSIPDQLAWEDEPISEVPFTVWDPDTPADLLEISMRLVFTNSTGAPVLSTFEVAGTGTNRWLTIIPPLDALGQSVASLTARDPQGSSSTVQFRVQILPVNDPPRISSLPNQDAVVGQRSWGILFSAVDPDGPLLSLRYRARSSRQQVLSDTALSFYSSGTNRFLRIDPTNSSAGSTVITVEVDDGQATNSTSLILTLFPPEFSPASTIQVSQGFEPVWGDFNGDGRMDLVTSWTTVMTNRGRGQFSAGFSIPASTTASGGAAADYDSDGRLDLLLFSLSGPPRLFRNSGESTNFSLVPVNWGTSRGRAAWADLDQDGDLDVVSGVNSIRWARNDGGGRFTDLSTDIPSQASPVLIAVGDFDQDGAPDILSGPPQYSASLSVPRLYRNLGAGHFVDSQFALPAGLVRSGGFTDVNGDGISDLWLAQSRTVETITVWVQEAGRLRGSFSYSSLFPSRTLPVPAWADFDNDGTMDFAEPWWPPETGLISTNITAVYHNDGSGHFEVSGRWLAAVAGNVLPPAADFDDDGSVDLLYYTGTPAVRLLTNSVSRPNALPSAPAASQSLVSGGSVLLYWGAAVDLNQSGALTYNVRLGTAPGKGDLISPMSTAAGTRMIPAPGNAGHRHWMLVSIPLDRLDTETLYWSVQAVDNGFQGGPFAPEQSFQINPPGNQPPEIVGLSDLLIPEDGVGRLTFTVSDDRSPPETLLVQARSSNPTLLPDTGVRLSGFVVTNGVLRVELTVAPATNQSGQAMVTISATDRSRAVREREILLNVIPVNDSPVLFAPPFVLGLAGKSIQPLAVTASDAESSIAEMQLSAVSLAPTIIPDSQITVSRTVTGWVVAARPAATVPATCEIALTVTDAAGGSDTKRIQAKLQRQTFSQIAGIQSTTGASPDLVAWADLNGDRRMELLTGSLVGAGTTVHNVSGSALPGVATLPGIVQDLADIDNDGDLDLLVAALATVDGASQPSLLIYRNKSGLAFEALPGAVFKRGAARFVDWDRDGRPDLLVAESAARFLLYRNGNNEFDAGRGLNLTANPPADFLASIRLADLDSDGIEEVLLNRWTSGSAPTVWRRRGDDLEPVVTPVWTGWVMHDLADFDGDGLPELIQSPIYGPERSIWVNRGNLEFQQASLVFAQAYSSARAVDFDGDGFTDVLGYGARYCGLWCGEPGLTFVAVDVELGGRNVTLVDTADFDGDGRLEVAMGIAGITPPDGPSEVLVFASEGLQTNRPPGAPTGLVSTLPGEGRVVLSWVRASDPEQTGGLTHNVRLGTTPGGGDILGPMALADGWRLLPRVGNAGWNTNLTLNGLAAGQTYYWSVQAVDNGFVGGAFAAEASFTTPALLEMGRAEPGGIHMRLSGAAGGSWNLEVSEDLVGWQAYTPVTNPITIPLGGMVEIEVSPMGARRFFRALPAN